MRATNPSHRFARPRGDGHVEWQSVNLMHGFLPALPRYFRQARQLLGEFSARRDMGRVGRVSRDLWLRLAREVQCKLVIDLYDNFEAFAATKLPGVLSMFRTAVKSADGITVFSQRLADYIVPDISSIEFSRGNLEWGAQGFIFSPGSMHLPAGIATTSQH